jgi:hypothetical protein
VTVNEIRLKAAELIEERGWCQRCAQDKDGSICADEAVALAAGKERGLLIAVHVGMGFYNDGPALFLWNDDPSRTKKEVLARLREGIA